MRALTRLLLGLILIVLVAWLGLWWYAEGRMEDGINGWATRMASGAATVNGDQIKVSYDAISRGTSPLAATVTVKNMRLVVNSPMVGPVSLNLPVVQMSISPANPTVMHIYPGSQLTVSATKGDAAITYGYADLIENLDSRALFAKTADIVDGSAFKLSDINVLASSGSLQVLHIDNIEAQARYDKTAVAGQTAIAVSEIFQGFTLSPLLTRFANLPFDGQIAELALTFNATGPVPANLAALRAQLGTTTGDQQAKAKLIFTALHDWAAAGGAANGTLRLVLGPTTLSSSANVKFDANVQPIAASDVTADHLDAFTQALANAYPQLQPQIGQFEAVMSPYLTTDSDNGQVLTLHITADHGNVDVNGKTLAPLPPVDWNALENPPAPAPDDGTPPAATPAPGQ